MPSLLPELGDPTSWATKRAQALSWPPWGSSFLPVAPRMPLAAPLPPVDGLSGGGPGEQLTPPRGARGRDIPEAGAQISSGLREGGTDTVRGFWLLPGSHEDARSTRNPASRAASALLRRLLPGAQKEGKGLAGKGALGAAWPGTATTSREDKATPQPSLSGLLQGRVLSQGRQQPGTLGRYSRACWGRKVLPQWEPAPRGLLWAWPQWG